ncbi:SDR family oxidoreductase [Natronosporangium hydrolyticum]|uniref:SDR family oxidoreductase n=1 Tax=Natronosporangium hydrolyticum TaxID=2811111 RepID=A0A895YDL3_9ACTN|nr:SDR family oxidoreductase [Natronosporangium hydrolyticum]QSB12636.1 SDR family oxidoreductase [Natronosporangium hydrolyticum]
MDQITVVTGGSRGIGAAIVRRLAAAGHDVVFTYRRDAAAAAVVEAEVGAVGRRCLAVAADVSVEADVERLFDLVVSRLGVPTGLVNNAGVTSPVGSFVDLATADLRRVVEVNLVGAMFCARRAAWEMGTDRGGRGGAIVNVSSAAATLGSPGEYVHYAAAKAGVEALTVGLAKELAPVGVRVNAVAPGIVDTELHARESGEPGRVARVAPSVPLGRAGEPAEVAGPVCWLLGPDASYTTGAVLRVAGGR